MMYIKDIEEFQTLASVCSQGSQLLQDHSSVARFGTGAVLTSDIQGAVSYDFSGKATISIWDRTSTTVVENSAFLSLKSLQEVSLITSDLALSHDVSAKAQLNLETDLDVGDTDNVKMCIRMHVPGFPIK